MFCCNASTSDVTPQLNKQMTTGFEGVSEMGANLATQYAACLGDVKAGGGNVLLVPRIMS